MEHIKHITSHNESEPASTVSHIIQKIYTRDNNFLVEKTLTNNGIHDAFNNLYYKILSYIDESDTTARKGKELVLAQVAEILWTHEGYSLSDKKSVEIFLTTLLAFPETPEDDYSKRVMDAYMKLKPVIDRN